VFYRFSFFLAKQRHRLGNKQSAYFAAKLALLYGDGRTHNPSRARTVTELLPRSKMREIISLQVGGAGNKIGERFFETLCAEHRVGPTGALLTDDNDTPRAVGRSHTPRTVANSAGAGEPVEGAAATTASLGGGGGGGGGGTHRHHHLHHHRATTHNDVTATDDSFTFFPVTRPQPLLLLPHHPAGPYRLLPRRACAAARWTYTSARGSAGGGCRAAY
jgi:hypothetical protein